jgi:N-acetylmuramic acid 6-phosphate etherase
MDHLTTEARNPASTNLDELTPLELVRLMTTEDGRVIGAVASQAEQIARAIGVIAERLRAGGRLVYVGAGTSGRLGVLDATECPPTFNSPPGQVVGLIAGGHAALTQAVEGAEDQPALAEQDLAALKLMAGDVLVGIATSGRTPYVLAAAAYARRIGAYTIGLSCNPDSELHAHVDLVLAPVVGPEVLSGSTRLKAGTATKLVLNMLSTGAMVCLGKTFGNLMVDLRATNSKLRSRANRIVRTLTGVTTETAEALLGECGGEVKTALVMHLAGTTAHEARLRLQSVGGRVREALPAAGSPETTHEELIFGIDGGGSKTVALLARPDVGLNSWTVLGRGEAGPSNLQAVGSTNALRALDEAVCVAFREARLARGPVAAAALGLAGADRPADRSVLQDWCRKANLSRQVEVTNDAVLLLAAGTPEGWGTALIAGTGSIAYARDREGRTARAGGWGYLLGDEGSGYALILAALQAVAQAADGLGQPTILTAWLLKELGIGQPTELIPAVYHGGWDRTALASLAPRVLEVAQEGDSVAARLVETAAAQLAAMVAAVVARLGLNCEALPLALAGGLLARSEPYRQAVLKALQAAGIFGNPVCIVIDPAEGALRLAMDLVKTRRGASPSASGAQ